MKRPQFTPEEQYLVDISKSPSATRDRTYMWTYLASGILLAAFATYHGSMGMMLAAFIVVCGFRIYEDWYQRRWEEPLRTLIQKYEAAFDKQ